MDLNDNNRPDGEEVEAGAKEAWDNTKDVAGNAWDKTKDVADDAGDKIKEEVDDINDGMDDDKDDKPADETQAM